MIARLNVGGPAIHVVELTRAMNEGRWRTRLVAGSVPEHEGDMGYYAERRGVRVTTVPTMSREIGALGDLRSLWTLYRLFRRERPDVVHTHTAKAGTLGRVAAVLARVPVRVHTYHGHVLGGMYFSPVMTRVFLGVEQLLARRTHRLVALTRRQADEMAHELGVAPRERFAVVPLGLDLARFTEVDAPAARARARAALGASEHDLLVGTVGRVVRIKNHELFLEVVSALGRRRPDVRALVMGSGEREGAIRRRAEAMGLTDRLLWLGWRDDLAELYPALDVLLLTSHDEGTPVAVLEALAAGTRVVAREVGGVAEVLGDLGCGAVVPREADAEAWADAVLAGVEAPPPSTAQRRRVAERFSVARLRDDLERLYLQELEGTGAVAEPQDPKAPARPARGAGP